MKKRLSNKEKMEMLVGKVVILLLQSLIGVGLVLGFFWVLGTVFNWVEQSTARTIGYFVVMGIILARCFYKEFNQ